MISHCVTFSPFEEKRMLDLAILGKKIFVLRLFVWDILSAHSDQKENSWYDLPKRLKKSSNLTNSNYFYHDISLPLRNLIVIIADHGSLVI